MRLFSAKLLPLKSKRWSVPKQIENLSQTSGVWRFIDFNESLSSGKPYNKFFVMSSAGEYSFSDNGIIWEQKSTASGMNFADATSFSRYGDNYYALGDEKYARTTSSNYNSWQLYEPSELSGYNGLTICAGKVTTNTYTNANGCIAILQKNPLQTYYSCYVNGYGWTEPSELFIRIHNYCSLYHDNKFIFASPAGYITTCVQATNRMSWQRGEYCENLELPRVTPSEYTDKWKGFCYDGTKYILLSSGGKISTSTDLLSWTNPSENQNLGNHNWQSITAANGYLIAISADGYVSRKRL